MDKSLGLKSSSLSGADDTQEPQSTRSGEGDHVDEEPKLSEFFADEDVEHKQTFNITTGIRLDKIPFKLKACGNGNIFTLHHTVQEGNKMIRIRIGVCGFNLVGNQLVAIDKRGNIFVFDFLVKKYWRLPFVVPKVCIICASIDRPSEYFLGTKLGQIATIDVESGVLGKVLQISQDPIGSISLPGPTSAQLLLVHAGQRGILVDTNKSVATHNLDFDRVQMALKFACYIPETEHIFTCFTNNSIYIWSRSTLDTLRVVHPLRVRDRKVKLLGKENIVAIALEDETDEFELRYQSQDYASGLIAAYCFIPEGQLLGLSTLDHYFLIFNYGTYELLHIFRFRDFVLKECKLLPKANEKIIIGLTGHGQMVMLDLLNIEYKLIFSIAGNATHMELADDAKLLAVHHSSGEVEIWSTALLFNALKSQKECMEVLREAFRQPKPVTVNNSNELLRADLKKVLKRNRLVAILREFGCYPGKYRFLIWSTLLRLPYNTQEFQVLLKMGVPTAVKQLTDSIRLTNDGAKRFLVTILSCLGHWCKVFAFSKFLPHLIFPFLQIFPKNALASFELCATLLLNHFQLWFEFHPMEPANYLGLIENLLLHYDDELIKFFAQMNIGTKHYAWILLSSAFSEVLLEDQWYILWDNIITNEPYFLVFCVVAYNMLQREVIMRLPDKKTIVNFYYEQNPIDIGKWMAKTRALISRCPPTLHPKKFIKSFEPLPKNCYPKFLNYPIKWVEQQEDDMLSLQREQRAIELRMHQLELEELEILKQLEKGLQEEEHAKRIKEMEKLYQDTLKREEERLAFQRKTLLLYQNEIRNRRGAAIAALQEAQKRQQQVQMETDLNALMHNIERERIRNDLQMNIAESEVRDQNLNLLANKLRITSVPKPPLTEIFSEDLGRYAQEKVRLEQNLKDITEQSTSKPNDHALTKLEKELNRIQKEIIRAICE